MNTSLVFQNTTFEIIDRNNQPWLRLPQIGGALGYKDEKSINRLFSRHEDEFSAGMKGVVELTTPGGNQKVVIVSLRGAHLLGMLAKTKVAKAFRAWVLDILESLATQTMATQPQLPKTLTPAQQCQVQNRVNDLAKQKGNSHQAVYRGIKNKFNVGTYKDITETQYPSLCKFLGIKPLEGELLDREPVSALDIKKIMLDALPPATCTIDKELSDAIERQSVSIALECFEISKEFIRRMVDYKCSSSMAANKTRALQVIGEVNLNMALTYQYYGLQERLIMLSDTMADMSQNYKNQIREAFVL
jgi:prophage antirepressor-like protein